MNVETKPAVKRTKRPAYKSVPCSSSTLASISDAFSAIEELASEVREIVDNAPEGLSETERIQTLGSTADELEGLQELELPEVLQEQGFSYSETFPTDKRRGPSRACRASNIANLLMGASARIDELLEDDEFKAANEDDWDSLSGEMSALSSELSDTAGTLEGCEFPGMFG